MLLITVRKYAYLYLPGCIQPTRAVCITLTFVIFGRHFVTEGNLENGKTVIIRRKLLSSLNLWKLI